MNSPHKGPVTRKMFPFDDVIMQATLKNTSNSHNFAKDCNATKTKQTREPSTYRMGCSADRIHYPMFVGS